jgi:epoxyqueuosine reductase
MDACPTGAIVKPYILDANLCISYWTIESKGDSFPPNITQNLNRKVLGCDLCLLACPFNRFEKPHKEKAFSRLGDLDLIETGKLNGLSQEEFNEKFSRSAVRRPGLKGLIRNTKAADISNQNIK